MITTSWCMYLPLWTKCLQTCDSRFSRFLVLCKFLLAFRCQQDYWWGSCSAPRRGWQWHSLWTDFSTSSAVTDGQHIYSHTSSGGAWCVDLVLQTTECKLANNVVNGQKRLAIYLMAKLGIHKCVFAPSLLNRSNLQRRCQLTQNEESFCLPLKADPS